MTDPDSTAVKLLLAEYERLKEEQKTRIGFRDNLLYVTLASMAGVIAATLSMKGHANLLLLLPPISTVLGWAYLVNDEKTSAIGRYIRTGLGPKLDPAGLSGVFGWEVAHRSDRRHRSRKVIQLFVDLGVFCMTALSAIAIYWINGPRRWPFLVVAVMELMLVFGLALEIIRYADLDAVASARRSSAAAHGRSDLPSSPAPERISGTRILGSEPDRATIGDGL